MNHKERVWQAISHQPVDRAPMHMNATKWVVNKLKKTFGVVSDKELLEKLHLDIYDMRGIDLHSGTAPLYIGPESKFFQNNWGGNIMSFWGIEEIEKSTTAGWLCEAGPPPLALAANLDELAQYNWPDVEWFDFSSLKSRLADWNDYAIMASGCSVFQHATYLRGMDILLMDMCMQPEMAHFVLKKISDFYYIYFEKMFQATGDMIDIFALADDFGMQNSLLISPEMFDEYVAPQLKRMSGLAHAYGKKLLLHSCGNIEILIPRLIELGVDILDPIQPECMNPLIIKEKYGHQICLRGGISVQNTLTLGTVDEVQTETKRIVEALNVDGGYILSPGHPVLQDDIPVENIIALYQSN